MKAQTLGKLRRFDRTQPIRGPRAQKHVFIVAIGQAVRDRIDADLHAVLLPAARGVPVQPAVCRSNADPTASCSGKTPVSSLEWMMAPSTLTSNRPSAYGAKLRVRMRCL